MEVELPPEHFHQKLATEIRRLKRHCDTYDAGEESAFEDIASTIALICVVKTQRGARLPNLLEIAGSADGQFVDLRVVRDPGNMLPYPTVALQGGTDWAFWVPLLDGSAEAPAPIQMVSFDEWWNGEALFMGHKEVVDGQGIGSSFSRRQVVEILRDKARSHNDAKWPEDFWKARAAFMKAVGPSGQEVKDDRLSPLPAIIRHVGHELIRSLEPEYRRAPRNTTDPLMMIQAIGAYRGSPEFEAISQMMVAAAFGERQTRRGRRRDRARQGRKAAR